MTCSRCRCGRISSRRWTATSGCASSRREFAGWTARREPRSAPAWRSSRPRQPSSPRDRARVGARERDRRPALPRDGGDLLARAAGAAPRARRRRLGQGRADARRGFPPGAARCDRDRQRRLALRRRARPGGEPPGDSHRLRRLAPGARLRGVLPARDQGPLGGACVRRRCGGDGDRPRARLQPRRRDRRPGDASRERALARRRVRRQLLARRQARRVPRVRQHRPSAARAPASRSGARSPSTIRG